MNLFNRIKFAAAVFDKNPEIQKLYKSGQLKLASEIDQPAKRPDVEITEAINAFMKRNPVEKAGGGMLVKPSADGSRPGYKGKATDKADELLKAYSEEGANSPIKREIKKKILTNPAFKKFTGDENLKKLSKLTSTEKGYTERNLINNFLT